MAKVHTWAVYTRVYANANSIDVSKRRKSVRVCNENAPDFVLKLNINIWNNYVFKYLILMLDIIY